MAGNPKGAAPAMAPADLRKRRRLKRGGLGVMTKEQRREKEKLEIQFRGDVKRAEGERRHAEPLMCGPQGNEEEKFRSAIPSWLRWRNYLEWEVPRIGLHSADVSAAIEYSP